MHPTRLISKRVKRKVLGYPDEWAVVTYFRVLAHSPTLTDEMFVAASTPGKILLFVNASDERWEFFDEIVREL